MFSLLLSHYVIPLGNHLRFTSSWDSKSHLAKIYTNKCKALLDLANNLQNMPTTQPATRRRGDVVTTSLYRSQWRRRYVSNETPNDVSVESRQDVSVVRLHYVLLELRDDVLRGRNNDVPSVRLHDASNMSQMKHPTTSQ